MRKNLLRVIGLLIFAWILYRINLPKTVPILRNVDVGLVGISALLAFPLMALKAVRWQYLLAMQEIRYPTNEAISAYMASYYIGLVTPGRVGDFIKVVYLKKARAVPYGKALVSSLMDRLLDLVFIVAVAIGGVYSYGLFERFGYVSLALLALMVVSFWALFNKKILDRVTRVLYRLLSKEYRDRVELHFGDFAGEMHKLRSIRLSVPVVLTFLAYYITFLQCHLLARAVHLDVSFFYVAFTISIAGIVALMPISFAGIGTRDATVIFLFGLRGIGSQQAVSFSLLYMLVFILVMGLWGAVHWFRRPLKV
jgi:uncharacterized protein (TIRG00374 family)